MAYSNQAAQVAATEDVLLEQGKRIRALHEIISRPDLSFDEQIDETLRLGCQLLGTEVGKLGRQDPKNNVSEFLNTIVMSDLPARRGVVLPLDKTYCDITFSSPEALVISNVKQSQYKDHPAVEFLGIHSYIGCSINVHGKKFGTVNFSNRTPVAQPFTEADKDFLNLIGSWISVMMERKLDAEELKASKDAAERANQAKTSFLANMSHEIRTPLTAIIGFADMALHDEMSKEQRVDALQKIRWSGDHLLHLINDILDLSKVEAEEMDIELSSVNLFRLMADVENIVSAQAKLKGLDFGIDYKYPLPEKIETDPLRLKQVLLNLSNNAIKFTDTGSVRIQLSLSDKDNELKIAVVDTGIGLSKEQIEKIFLPFRQADSSTARRFGGTGLGLSLSKKLSTLLNGELTADGELHKGSCFELKLKLTDNSEIAKAKLITSLEELDFTTEQQASHKVANKLSGHILLAEDDELNQELIAMYLEDMGATVSVAENGQVAVDKVKQQQFDLIYMDMQMPELSGPDALKQLRSDGYQGPIVMLTANATLEDRNLCKQAGSDDFVTKPIDEERLYEVTARYLNSKQ